jgi:serine/threonine-protein kinase RsbW
MVPSPLEVSSREAGPYFSPTAYWRSRTLHASGEIVPAIEDIIASLDAAGFSHKETFGVRLALEEALVNAIKHGHKGDPSKEVHLRYHLTAECLVAEVEDQGPGFNPQEVPDPFVAENLERPCGRGLLLMRNYMTWVRFNSLGNRVTMCRLRRGA